MKTILFLTFLAGLFGCFFSDTTATLGAKFILKKGETATIKTTGVRVKMLSAGHLIFEEGDHKQICRFEASSKNKTKETEIRVGNSIKFENLNIKVISVDLKTNPKASDPWSENSCGFIVTKSK